MIDGWIEETISGTKAYNKRELGKLLKRIQKDDLIICAELSRLGRNLFMIMEILNNFNGSFVPWTGRKQQNFRVFLLKTV